MKLTQFQIVIAFLFAVLVGIIFFWVLENQKQKERNHCKYLMENNLLSKENDYSGEAKVLIEETRNKCRGLILGL